MEILIGKVKHFYGHIPAMVVELDEDLKIGNEIIVRKKIQSANAGTEVAILAAGKTKEGDLVYKIVP